ncbi:MAG: hypothetical protein ABI662_00115 [Dermatophilaceae bacterium]
MFAGTWCEELGISGWVLMGLFWATFLGLVLWAVSRLFAPRRVAKDLAGPTNEPYLRSASGPLDIDGDHTLRGELTSSERYLDKRR